jgi:hypothetical protein
MRTTVRFMLLILFLGLPRGSSLPEIVAVTFHKDANSLPETREEYGQGMAVTFHKDANSLNGNSYRHRIK